MFKKEIRLKYKELRNSLSETQIEEMSLAIANEVLFLPIWEKTYFHVFLPIQEQKEVDTESLLHLLSGKDKEICISKSDFEEIETKIPPTLEEQTAIAQVLQAADKEISLLKAKADKLREQKKGLMQVLLTGKKRLSI